MLASRIKLGSHTVMTSVRQVQVFDEIEESVSDDAWPSVESGLNEIEKRKHVATQRELTAQAEEAAKKRKLDEAAEAAGKAAA
eukprot:5077496-Pyramimonas_sp.AAC.1